MRRLLVPLAAALVLATACGHPLIPSSALKPPPPTPAPTLKLGQAPARHFTYRRRPPILGVDLYSLHNYSAATATAYGQRTLSYIKDTLHADAVGIAWNLYARSDLSNSVYRSRRNSLSPADVAILTNIAKGLHLKVEYRPEIFVPSARNPWQGRITPTNQLAWMHSYYRVLLPYLKNAERLGIKEFVLTNEMHKMNGSPYWGRFFGWARRVFHGTVSYTAWDEDYLPTAQAVLPVRLLGTNFYRPLFLPGTTTTMPDSATTAQVTRAWEAYFAQVPAAVLERTAIDETGISARVGAYRYPGNMWRNDHRDERVQVNWYLAACHTVMRYHMRGVFFWKVDLADNPAHPATSLSTFEGRKGALAISECARILHPRSAA